MPVHALSYQGQQYEIENGDSVLDILLRNGVGISHSCRKGSCHCCLMRRVDGDVPLDSQPGLTPTLREQKFFLACQFKPDESIEVANSSDAAELCSASLLRRDIVNESICRLWLEPDKPFAYRAGQYLNLLGPNRHARPYSIASVANADSGIELHVRKIPGGTMSHWLHDELKPGETLQFHGPYGACFYIDNHPDQDLLLIGTGTGIAPLYGIAKDALLRGHTGLIQLFHGTHDEEDQYLSNELRELASMHCNFHYTPCVSGTYCSASVTRGRASDVAFAQNRNLSGVRVFICGLPAMVQSSRQTAYLNGASIDDILYDAFEFYEKAG